MLMLMILSIVHLILIPDLIVLDLFDVHYRVSNYISIAFMTVCMRVLARL